jgi:hypothetical protein
MRIRRLPSSYYRGKCNSSREVCIGGGELIHGSSMCGVPIVAEFLLLPTVFSYVQQFTLADMYMQRTDLIRAETDAVFFIANLISVDSLEC